MAKPDGKAASAAVEPDASAPTLPLEHPAAGGAAAAADPPGSSADNAAQNSSIPAPVPDGQAGSKGRKRSPSPIVDDDEDVLSDTFMDINMDIDSALPVDDSGAEDLQPEANDRASEHRVHADLNTLCGRPFSAWMKEPRSFAKEILQTPFSHLLEIALNDDILLGILQEMNASPTKATGRGATLKTVADNMESGQDITSLLVEKTTNWPPIKFWTKLMIVAKSRFFDPTDSVLKRAGIRSPMAVQATIWVLIHFAKICTIKEQRARYTKQLADIDRKATEAKRVAQAQNSTYGMVSFLDARKAAKLSVRMVASSSAFKTPKQSKKRRKIIADEIADEEVFNAPDLDAEVDEAEKDKDTTGNEEAEVPFEPIDGKTDDEIEAAYVNAMLSAEARAKQDPRYIERLHYAAKGLIYHMRRMRQKPRTNQAYLRDLQLQYKCVTHHLDDISTIPGKNRKTNPIRHAARDEFLNNQATACWRSGATEEEQDPKSRNEVQDVLEAEEQVEIEASEDQDREPIATEMVTIPTDHRTDESVDMFKDNKNMSAFAPTYLRAACIEAKITDINRRVMPNTTKALYWWQVIGTKWAKDLEHLTEIRGGIVADQIGLGKTLQAAGIWATTIENYKDRHPPTRENSPSESAAPGKEQDAPAPEQNPPAPEQNPPAPEQNPPAPEQNPPAPEQNPPAPVEHTAKPVEDSQPKYDGPERPGDFARPSCYVAPKGLCDQVAREFKSFYPTANVIFVGGDAKTANGAYSCSSAFPKPDHPIWDPERAQNIRTLFVVSFNKLVKDHGPEAYWTNVKADLPAYLKQINHHQHGFNAKSHFSDPANIPTHCPTDFQMHSLEGKFAHVFCDEVQDHIRNFSTTWWTIKWLRPMQMILMSGYPAPRGLVDFAAYLRLLERDELGEEEKRCSPQSHGGYRATKTNPYNLPDNHPGAKFRLLYVNMKKWLLPSTSPSPDEKIAQSKAAQDTLSLFVLRRDFDTYLPSRPDVTIGSALPPKHHFTVERIFTPSDQRTYDNQFARWQQRLFTSHRNSAGQDVPATNSRAQRATQMIEFFPSLGHLHIESPYEKRPKEEAYGDGDDHLDEKYNRDRESFFYEKSQLHKEFQAISYEKGKANRIRWLLSKIQHFTDELVDGEGKQLQFANMSPAALALEFIKRSPKMQAILSLHMDWCLLRNEKMIFWFNTPILQMLTQEILEALGYNMFSVYSHNSLDERTKIQRFWNSPTTVNRVLLASALVFGTGFNLQKDSRAACLVDTPDTDNREKQIIGRQYRGGQDLPVMFFRLTVRGAHSVARFQDNLLKSLAANSAFIDYTPDALDEFMDLNPPTELFEKIRNNYLEGFVREAKFPNAAEPRDFVYHFIFSERGQELVEQWRAQPNHDGSPKPPSAWPDTLPFTIALAGIAAVADTRTVKRIAGFPEGTEEIVIELTKDELSERKSVRMARNGGVDPDERFYPKATPKKTKASKAMARLDDNQEIIRDDVVFSGKIAELGKSDKDSKDENVFSVSKVYGNIAEEDDAKLSLLRSIVKQEAEPDEPTEDMSDFEPDATTQLSRFEDRMNKYESYLPTYNDVSHLSPTEKGKLTRLAKQKVPSFKGYSASQNLPPSARKRLPKSGANAGKKDGK